MVDNYWVMLALVAAYFILTNFINVRYRKKQGDTPAPNEPIESLEPAGRQQFKAVKEVPLPKKGTKMYEASSPEALSKRRNSKGW